MARWEPDPRGRLKQAALDLYDKQGFDATTVAQIAEHAGLTERTFFRHFADKREVLFTGDIYRVFIESLAAAPPSAAPVDAVIAAFEAGAERLDEQRDRARQRQALIAATPTLRERELVKLASLAADMAETLEQRGVDGQEAALAAEVGIAVYKTAMSRWMEDDTRGLPEVLRDTRDRLPGLTPAS